MIKNHQEILVLTSTIVELFETFLDTQGIELNNPEKQEAIEDGAEPDTIANIYGTQFGDLTDGVQRILEAYRLIDDTETESPKDDKTQNEESIDTNFNSDTLSEILTVYKDRLLEGGSDGEAISTVEDLDCYLTATLLSNLSWDYGVHLDDEDIKNLVNDKANKLVDPKGKIILEDWSENNRTTKLLYDPNNLVTHYIVAHGYDQKTGEWDQGEYYATPLEAERWGNPYWYGEAWCLWSQDDIHTKLADYFEDGDYDTPKNVRNVEFCLSEYFDKMVESQCEAGWNYIEQAIDKAKNKGELEVKKEDSGPEPGDLVAQKNKVGKSPITYSVIMKIEK